MAELQGKGTWYEEAREAAVVWAHGQTMEEWLMAARRSRDAGCEDGVRAAVEGMRGELLALVRQGANPSMWLIRARALLLEVEDMWEKIHDL